MRITITRNTIDMPHAKPLSAGKPMVVNSEWNFTSTHETRYSSHSNKNTSGLRSVQGQEAVRCVWRLVRGGTWSTPPGFHGWQRSSRRTPSQTPRTGPWISIASAAYREHEG